MCLQNGHSHGLLVNDQRFRWFWGAYLPLVCSFLNLLSCLRNPTVCDLYVICCNAVAGPVLFGLLRLPIEFFVPDLCVCRVIVIHVYFVPTIDQVYLEFFFHQNCWLEFFPLLRKSEFLGILFQEHPV